jgi:hypothetical protein
MHFFADNTHVKAITTVRLSNHADRLDGKQQYRFGNEWQWYIGLFKDYLLKKTILTPDVTLRYRYTESDQTDREATPNTSGHWLSFLPSLSYKVTSHFSLQVHGEIPIYRDLVGTQLTTTYRIGMNLIYLFDLSE